MVTEPDTITELMDRDPLDLSSGDIERIIAYHRKNREAGPRPKKIRPDRMIIVSQ